MNSLRPTLVTEVQGALSQMTEKSKFIGGGTDYIIRIKDGVEHDFLCYLGHIKEYKGITEDDSTITIGAYTTMTEIEHNAVARKYLMALVDSASDVGSLQIRNNGTIGGNIGNASPAGDLLPVLTMYGAVVKTISPTGEREVPMSEIIARPGKTTLAHNEAITHIIIPKPDYVNAFVKLGSRKKVTISRIGVSVGVIMAGDKVDTVSIYAGAIGIKPVNLTEAEDFLKGKELSEDNILAVAKILSDYIHKNVAVEFDRDYKVNASKGVVSDVFARIKARI